MANFTSNTTATSKFNGKPNPAFGYVNLQRGGIDLPIKIGIENEAMFVKMLADPQAFLRLMALCTVRDVKSSQPVEKQQPANLLDF